MFKIEEFLKEQDFWREDTKEAILGMYAYMRNYDISSENALSWLTRIVSVMRHEYGD